MSMSAAQSRAVASRVPSPKRFGAQLLKLGLLLLLAGLAWKSIASARMRIALTRSHDELRSYQPLAAVERLQTLVRGAPDCAEAHFLLAVAKRRAGSLAQVDPHLVRAEELGWDPKSIERQRYLTRFQAGDIKHAGPYVKQLFDQGGSDDEAEEVCEAMVRGYYAGLLFREARMIVKYWNDWQPHNPQPYFLQAEEAVLLNELDPEIAAYRKILAFDPRHFDARLRLAHALVEQHEFNEAFELFSSCEHDRPDDADTLIGLASCLEQQGRLDESRQKAEAALRLPLSGAERAYALDVQARAATAVRDHAEAARLYQQVVELAPGVKSYVYALGQSLQRAGRAAEAKKWMQEWDDLKQVDNRLDEIRDLLLTKPDDADLRCEVGQLQFKKGGHDVLGVNWLLSAVMRDAGHPAANEALADYYRSIGETALAERHLAAIDRRRASQPRRASGPLSQIEPSP